MCYNIITMNIVKTIEQYNDDYVYFCDPIKNNIMNDGNFIRILYSTPIFILNGIYLSISINQLTIEKYYNKYKCHFDTSTSYHKQLINKLQKIEDSILSQISIKHKVRQYKLHEQLVDGNIRFFLETDLNEKCIMNGMFILKISGVWENENHYGLTYKFVKIKSTIKVALAVGIK